jgi:hypothetical protein
MKELWMTFAVFAILIPEAYSQHDFHHCKKREMIKAQKVAFITEKLDLTVEEAQKFWPVYNELNKKLEEIDIEKRTLSQKYEANKESLSDNEVTEIYTKLIELETKEIKLNTEFRKEMKEIISVRKMMELHMAERMFKHELLNKIKHCEPPQE